MPLARLLDAIPLAAGIVDRDGTLVATNNDWRRARLPVASIGVSDPSRYVESLRRSDAPQALGLAAWIERMLLVEHDGNPSGGASGCELVTTTADRTWITRAASAGAGAVLVTHEIVSRSNRAYEDARRDRARLRTILTGAPLALFAVDLEGRFTLVEGMAVNTVGLITPQVVGRLAVDEYAHLPAFVQAVESALQGSDAVTTVEVGRTAFELRCSPDIAASGRQRGVVGVATDVTERVRAQRVKDDFVSAVNHELRTPLTSIHGSLSLLENNIAGDLPPEAVELTKIARTSVDRLIRLISDLLDLDRLDSGRFEVRPAPIDLRAVVKDATQELDTFARDADVEIRLAESPACHVYADRDRIHQVVANLLSNAIKFSPTGSRVDVAMSSRSGTVRVAVTDRGPGIAPEDRPRLFQKFSQLHADVARRGSGLGLAISKAIVEAHGGRLSLVSEVGRGSTFFFELTAHKGRARTVVAEHQAVRAPPREAPPHRVPGDVEAPGAGLDLLLRLFESPRSADLGAELRDAHARVQLLLARLGRDAAKPGVLKAVTSLRCAIERELDRFARGSTADLEHLRAISKALHAAARGAGEGHA